MADVVFWVAAAIFAVVLLVVLVVAGMLAAIKWTKETEENAKQRQRANSRWENVRQAEDEAVLAVTDLLALHQSGKLEEATKNPAALFSAMAQKYPALSKRLFQKGLGDFVK